MNYWRIRGSHSDVAEDWLISEYDALKRRECNSRRFEGTAIFLNGNCILNDTAARSELNCWDLHSFGASCSIRIVVYYRRFGTSCRSGNVGKKLPFCSAWSTKIAQITRTPLRKPEIRQSNFCKLFAPYFSHLIPGKDFGNTWVWDWGGFWADVHVVANR